MAEVSDVKTVSISEKQHLDFLKTPTCVHYAKLPTLEMLRLYYILDSRVGFLQHVSGDLKRVVMDTPEAALSTAAAGVKYLMSLTTRVTFSCGLSTKVMS